MQAITSIVSQIQELVDDRSADLPGDVHLALCKLTKQAYEESKGTATDAAEEREGGNESFNEINALVESAHQGRRSPEDFLLMIREPNNTLALAALAELARDGDWNMHVFVRPVVGLVRARDASDATKLWALRLLVAMFELNTSAAKEYGGEMLAAGIFFALTQLLERNEELTETLDEACLEVLFCMVACDYNPLLHHSPGVVHALIPRITDPRYQATDASPIHILYKMAASREPWCSKTVDFLSNSMDAMCAISELTFYHKDNPYQNEQYDTVQLLSLIARGNGKNSEVALANLPATRQIVHWVIDQQKLCLRTPDGLGCRLRAAECLGHLARAGGEEVAEKIADAGAIPPLAELLDRRGATRTQRSWVAHALTYTCRTDARRDEFVAAGGLSALKSALDAEPAWFETTEERPKNTARFLLAIGDIALRGPQRRAEICNTEGLLAHFASAIHEENAIDLRGAAAAALSNVCFRNPVAKLALCRMGAIETVVKLLRSDEPRLRHVGCRLTANLAAQCIEAREEVAKAGGLDALFEVVRRGNAGELKGSCEAAESALIQMTNLTSLVSASRKRPREEDPPADPPTGA